jgi:hypothetical protein
MSDSLRRLITEIWKQESQPLGKRLIELEEKAQDSGLTYKEKIEYEAIKKRIGSVVT